MFSSPFAEGRRQRTQDQSCCMMRTDRSWIGSSALQISCPPCTFGGFDDSWLLVDGIQDVERSMVQRFRPFAEIKVVRPQDNFKTKIKVISNIGEPLPRSIPQLRCRNNHLKLTGFGSLTTCRDALGAIQGKPCLQKQSRQSFSVRVVITNNQDPSSIRDVRLQA